MKKAKSIKKLSSIILAGQTVPYTLNISSRARHMRLSVYRGGSLVVTIPSFMHTLIYVPRIEHFLQQKAAWILKHIRSSAASVPTVPPIARYTKAEYIQYKAQAQLLAEQKVATFNQHYGYTVGTITIRNQKTRWGSCSKKGNLNFHYAIALLPEPLVDYLVVHELCHIRQFNHSKAFWALVAEKIPDYIQRRRQLRAIGLRGRSALQ